MWFGFTFFVIKNQKSIPPENKKAEKQKLFRRRFKWFSA